MQGNRLSGRLTLFLVPAAVFPPAQDLGRDSTLGLIIYHFSGSSKNSQSGPRKIDLKGAALLLCQGWCNIH